MIYNGFLINRDADKGRLAAATTRLDELGIDFERVGAVESWHPEHSLKSTMALCLEKAIERKLPYATIIEDDCIFRHWDQFEGAFKKLPADWQVFYPYRWTFISHEPPVELDVVPITMNICGHFVMFNWPFYQHALQAMKLSPLAADRVFDQFPKTRRYATTYNLAGQDANTSTIDRVVKELRWNGKAGCK